jgi:hypothetical protein
MHAHIYYMITRQREAESRRAAEYARLGDEVSGRRRKLRELAPVALRRSHRGPSRPRDRVSLEVEQPGGCAR